MSDRKDYGSLRASGSTPEEKIISAIAATASGMRLSKEPFAVGEVEKRMSDFAQANGIELGDSNLSMSPFQIQHALRDTKQQAGIAVDPEELVAFPSTYKQMDLYYDSRKQNFLYVSGRSKFAIEPNHSVKKYGRRVNFITASRLSGGETFPRESGFIKIP